jgi:hypothetical protein
LETHRLTEDNMNTLKKKAQELAQYGRNGDTMLAHITPEEAALLKAVGGSGTTNPNTGLPEFFIPALIGAGVGLLGSSMQASSARSAARTQADAQTEAARIAAEESRFRPVAIRTGFGGSQFTTDEDGRVSGASYELNPELQALRNQLMQQAQQQGFGLTQQGLGAAQGLFGLGQGLMPTSTQYGVPQQAQDYVDMLRRQAAMAAPAGFDRQATAEAQALSGRLGSLAESALPASFQRQATQGVQDYAQGLQSLAGQITPQSFDTQAAAQRFFQQQQDILRPEREQALSGLQNRLAQTGTQGLGVAQAGGGQANPLMQAFANAQAQQDRVLAGQAEQQARQNLVQDVELGTRLGGAGVSAMEQSAQQQLQNALEQARFGTGLLGSGFDVSNQSAQQQLMNALELGRFSTGQAGLGLTAEQQALEFDRSRMLGDIQASTGLFSDAMRLAAGGYSPLTTQLQAAQGIEGMGQQALELGSALGGRIANPAGAQALQSGGNLAAATLGSVQGYNPMGTALSGLSQNQQFINALGGMFGNRGTAQQYGTNPFSQQTSMLAAQDAWFR